MKVRCNYCFSIFDEKYIIAHENGDDLVCPCCGHDGCIMDVPDDEFPQYYKHTPSADNVTSAGVITTEFYDDEAAKGIKVMLNNEIVAMLDVHGAEDMEAEGAARVLVYHKSDHYDAWDEPIACITVNK